MGTVEEEAVDVILEVRAEGPLVYPSLIPLLGSATFRGRALRREARASCALTVTRSEEGVEFI